jgi:protein ImuB
MLARERFASLALPEPVRSIALAVDDVTPLAGRNLGLLLEPGKPQGDWERLVERLRARLGAKAVSGLAVQSEYRPELASAAAEPGTKQQPLEFGERPMWLLESPRPLAEIDAKPHHEGPLELLAGPERIESGWWDGGDVTRDYFIARMRNEALVWIYRERSGGGWYLHGLFA